MCIFLPDAVVGGMTIYFKLVMFPDVMHIKVNNGHNSAILNLFKHQDLYLRFSPT